MTNHRIGTRNEWLTARLELLTAEKELTRLNDDLARRRREMPWVRLDKGYTFDTEGGESSLADLFRQVGHDERVHKQESLPGRPSAASGTAIRRSRRNHGTSRRRARAARR